MLKTLLTLACFGGAMCAGAANCNDLPSAQQLHDLLARAPSSGGDEGGLFHGKREWGAVVNREGEICAVAVGTSDPLQVWSGSLSIAEAKAYTANAFSLDDKPMSTARLYTMTQPGHSLWGIAASNPFVAANLKTPSQGLGNGNQKLTAGLISFGGGVPLYKNNKLIGGLGVSGDTACADHETAKRVRNMAGLNPKGGMKADDITYPSVDGATVFSHPLCENTYRDGKFLGNEELPAFDRAPATTGTATRRVPKAKK